MGEVVKLMGKTKVLVKTGQEGKYIVDFANDIKLEDLRPNLRVALRSDCESAPAGPALVPLLETADAYYPAQRSLPATSHPPYQD